jgi:sentrin-specific protease 7
MPPLPGNEFTKLFNGITNFFKSSEHAEDHGNDDESHATARSEDMDDEVVEQSGASVRKRPREAHEDQPKSAKKQRTHSQEEVRLAGLYNGPTPRDACRVMVPTNEHLDDDFAPGPGTTAKVTRPAKPVPGVHRTKNTLNNSQPGHIGARTSKFTQVRPQPTVSKPVTRAPPNESIGDGFSDLKSTRATPAKRRATNGAPKAPPTTKPIDITGDADDLTMGDVEAVNGHRISSDSQNSVIELNSSHSPPKPAFFVSTEMRNVNRHTNPQPPKKRRHDSSAQGSFNNGSHNQGRPNSRQTNRSSEIDDLATSASRLTRTMGPMNQKNMKPGVPPIDLGKGTGVGDIKAARDLKLMNGSTGALRPRHDHAKHHSRGLPEGRTVEDPMFVVSAYTKRDAGSRSQGRTGAEELAHASRGEQREEPRLAAQFYRAPNSPPAATRQHQYQQQQQQQQEPRQRRAKEAMQVSSDNGGSKAFEDSPDQLQSSPNLSRRSANGRSSVSVTGESPRQHSPSDLKTTTFTSGSTKSTSVSQLSRKAKKPSAHTDDSPVRIPVARIHCIGCPLESTESHPVELVWRGDEAHFEVEENGQPASILGRNEIMSIGSRDASNLHYNQDSTKVALQGSSSAGRSNGWILLQFPDLNSRKDFEDHLMVASRDRMKTTHEKPVARMDKLFERQAEIVQGESEKYALKMLAERKTARQYETKQAARRTEHRPSSEERITYEQPDGGSSNRASPYFSGKESWFRKSTRQSKAVVERSPSPEPVAERWTQTNPQIPWHQSVMYPATGARRITVDFQDLERLDEGEFLNDNIVGYALRRIEESMAPEHKSKVHFFNSYFFTSLTSKNGRKTFNYESVKKWTKQKDLFDIPYVVVPINENFHWYAAIICNLPSLKRKTAALDDRTSDAAATPSTSQQASARPSPIRDPVVPDSQEDNDRPDAQAMEALSIESERTSREGSELFPFGEDGKVASSDHTDLPVQVKGGKKSKKRTAPALPKYPTDKPIIITLDSFGQAHTGQVASLKDYVAAEAMDKRGMEVGREDMKGMTATGVPLQQNFCDCGLYLVGYVAEFAKDPEGFVSRVLTRQLDGQSDFAAFDASKKRDEIRADLLRLHDEQDAERMALKKAKKDSKIKGPMTAVADASTSVASAGTRSSPGRGDQPAKSISTVEQSDRAHATTSANPAPPTRNARESSVSASDAVGTAREKLQQSAPSDASDNDEMDSGMPRALTSDKSPKKAKQLTIPLTQIDDGEMLDDHHDEDTIECRPRGMRKVVSPELDVLSTIINAGPPAAPLHAHEKSPGSEKPSP